MKQQLYIEDHQLPETQDFQALKSSALDFLKTCSGSEWTNFNPSDPGITILDQVCFALTELGYCNDFPIEDILTNTKGRIVTKDQFYLPQTILTTSPVTADDYRKYLIDSNQEIKNAIVIASPGIPPYMRYIYHVFLLLDERLSETEKNDVCTAAYYSLNKSRNIGELFLGPQPVSVFPVAISGHIDIDNQAQLNETLAAINNAVQQYIFPTATQQGFDRLRQEGYTTSDIFDGPLLINGWFTPQTLGVKRSKLNAMDLMNIICKVKGVEQVGQLGLNVNGKAIDELIIPPGKLPSLDLQASLSADLKIVYKGHAVTANNIVKQTNKPHGIKTGNVYLDLVEQNDQVKSGRYRDIDSYYSIQNTFPAIFATGGDSSVGDSTKYVTAQTRQLKAYLTLFDQVLANQFAQLAGVRHLFSFRNSLTADPTDEMEYYSAMGVAQKAYPEYPAPYVYFSPTYYYRSLYDVPNIRPLLKDNDVKRFYSVQQTLTQVEQDSWEAFKHDPYNAYIHCLAEFIENESISITRRNAMLDHLLARHGESPLEIDEMLNGSVYSGDTAKDLVIFKSLYLQNLGLLSYFRQKGYNPLAAKKILPVPGSISPDFEEQILSGNNRDFIFDSSKIDHLEKLTVTDFDNYSAIELKLCLFFGLRIVYLNFILCNYSNPVQQDNIRHGMWMIMQRKGLILVENGLLQKNFSYQVIITKSVETGPWFQAGSSLNYNEAWEIVQAFTDEKDNTGDYENSGIVADGKQYKLTELKEPQEHNKFFKHIPGSSYYFTVKIDGKYELERFDEFPVFKSDLEFIFPAFILPPENEAFEKRIRYFLTQCLPVHLTYDVHFLGSEQLQAFIPAFIYCHNQLIFKPKHHHHGTA